MTRVAAVLLIFAGGVSRTFAQIPADSGVVVGVGGFSHIVANVEKSVEFYRDVLGLEMPNPPRAFDSTQWIIDMGNTPGAQSRPAILRIPGSKLGIELIDYKDIDRTAAHPRFQDPGAASLILTVRDIDPLMAKLTAAHAHINSKGGEPATIVGANGGRGRVVFVQDPDGFFIELSQRDPAPRPPRPRPAISSAGLSRSSSRIWIRLCACIATYWDFKRSRPRLSTEPSS
jgi:catechol 2,3-dioxygenase-like lactoylglutathione lyase family enzyme